MRYDNIGLFWQDIPTKKGRADIIRPMPPIPDTGWQTPTTFPDLRGEPIIAVDTETYDPDLMEAGPGWARGKGHIVGISISTSKGNWYFPIRHEVEKEYNMDAQKVFAWLSEVLANEKQYKVGANIMYDIGWLQQEGVFVKGPLLDIQFAEALLTETGKVGLDTLGNKYLNIGKATSLLYQWCADFYGGQPTSDQRKNIYRCPPRIVGPYAESDTYLPLLIIEKQWERLQQEGLTELFLLECRLIPLLIAMRFKGVRVNVEKAEQAKSTLLDKLKEVQGNLDHMAGFHVEVAKAAHLAKAFDQHNIPYRRTPKGAPSFTKLFLEEVEHPLADLIKEVRRIEKIADVFIDSYILKNNVDGIVYGQFHPLRSDSYGTRSGRLSASHPNLQNIPSRDEELAPLVRGLFIPDEDCHWVRFDYSQIEYRFLIHFAQGPGADAVRNYFNDNPNTDYHDMVLDLVAPFARWSVATPAERKQRRKPLKTINFGLIYGMGKAKLVKSLGLSTKEGEQLFAAYHNAVSYAKSTMDAAALEAERTGNVRTILNRCSRFELWESAEVFGSPALEKTLAYKVYGTNIKRAYTHKALNRKLQGSAADMMKMAMVLCWEHGVFDITGVPSLTVHDELDFSCQKTALVEEGLREVQHLMETCIPLLIPVKAEKEVGPDWGHCK